MAAPIYFKEETENERLCRQLAERDAEIEGLRNRVAELEEIATEYGLKFQRAQDALKHAHLMQKLK